MLLRYAGRLGCFELGGGREYGVFAVGFGGDAGAFRVGVGLGGGFAGLVCFRDEPVLLNRHFGVPLPQKVDFEVREIAWNRRDGGSLRSKRNAVDIFPSTTLLLNTSSTR